MSLFFTRTMKIVSIMTEVTRARFLREANEKKHELTAKLDRLDVDLEAALNNYIKPNTLAEQAASIRFQLSQHREEFRNTYTKEIKSVDFKISQMEQFPVGAYVDQGETDDVLVEIATGSDFYGLVNPGMIVLMDGKVKGIHQFESDGYNEIMNAFMDQEKAARKKHLVDSIPSAPPLSQIIR